MGTINGLCTIKHLGSCNIFDFIGSPIFARYFDLYIQDRQKYASLLYKASYYYGFFALTGFILDGKIANWVLVNSQQRLHLSLRRDKYFMFSSNNYKYSFSFQILTLEDPSGASYENVGFPFRKEVRSLLSVRIN